MTGNNCNIYNTVIFLEFLMSIGYTIVVACETKNDFDEIRSNLDVLRNTDAIINCPPDRIVEFSRKNLPDVLIVFAHRRNEKLFEACKIIRQDVLLKSTPIIFIFDELNEQFIMDSLNAGISDYIISPVKKIDILAHMTWGLKKSKLMFELEMKEMLLKDLGVIDRETGLYTSKYIPMVFANQINLAKDYNYSVMFVSICIDDPYRNKTNNSYLSKVIKKCVRSSDLVGAAEYCTYYMLLPKTDLSGANVVLNKINKTLAGEFTVSTGVCELTQEMSYTSLSGIALKAMEEVSGNKDKRIPVFEAKKPDPAKPEPVKPSESMKTVNIEKPILSKKPLESTQSKNWIDKIQTNKKSYENFRIEFSKKIDNVITPVFYKKRDSLKLKYPSSIIIDLSASEKKCFFSIKEIYEETENILKITDSGLSNLVIERCLISHGKQSLTRTTVELEELDEIYLDHLLQDLFHQLEVVSDLEKLINTNN